MKYLIFMSSLFFVGNVFAASGDLICTSDTGKTLTWSERYGELNVIDANGDVLVNLDALRLGKSKYIETTPSMIVTPIVFADELPTQTFAEIQKIEDVTIQIELDNEVFVCGAHL